MAGPTERSGDRAPDGAGAATTRTRILATIGGALCLALGIAVGWIGALQTARAPVDAGGSADAARSEKAASRSAVQAEGWARVANGAFTLAKLQNEQAQTARAQARDFAARAEKAAGQAAVVAARAHDDRTKSAADAARIAADAKRAAADARRVAAAAPPASSLALADGAPSQAGAKPAAVKAAAGTKPAIAAKPAPRVARHLVAAARSSPAGDESCRRATIYERTAASASVSRQAAYNAATSGIAVNVHCSEPQRSLIEAYLLAQRASAEAALKTGDWQTDLARSDQALADCVKHPQHYGVTGRSCLQRLTRNGQLRAAAQRPAAKPHAPPPAAN